MCVCVCTCVKISVSPGRWRRVPALVWKRLRHIWRQPDVLGAHKGARTSAWEQGLSSGLLQNLCLAGWGLTWVPPPPRFFNVCCLCPRPGWPCPWMDAHCPSPCVPVSPWGPRGEQPLCWDTATQPLHRCVLGCPRSVTSSPCWLWCPQQYWGQCELLLLGFEVLLVWVVLQGCGAFMLWQGVGWWSIWAQDWQNNPSDPLREGPISALPAKIGLWSCILCLSCGTRESSASSARMLKESYKSLQLPIASCVLLFLCSGAEYLHTEMLCSKSPVILAARLFWLFIVKNREIFPPNFGPTTADFLEVYFLLFVFTNSSGCCSQNLGEHQAVSIIPKFSLDLNIAKKIHFSSSNCHQREQYG